MRKAETRTGRVAANLLLAGVSLGVTILLAEVALHVLDHPRAEVSQNRVLAEHDTLLGWRNIPGGHATIGTDEYRVTLTYNERGLRGDVIPYDKPSNTTRVMLVGDSFVDGYSIDLDDRVGELLETRLRELHPGRAFQVISLGTGGYGTDQEALWLEHEGLRYEPDVVVLLFYANDVWYNALDRYWRGSKPRFVLEGDRLVLTNVPVPLPAQDDDAGEDLPLGYRINDFLRTRSKLFVLATRAVQRIPALYALAVRAGFTAPSPELAFDVPGAREEADEFSVFEKDPPPAATEAWAVTDALIARMDSLVRAQDARFGVFLVPHRGTIYDADGRPRPSGTTSSGALDVEAVSRRLAETCRTTGVDCTDPRREFLAQADSLHRYGERLYYRYDWHWNPAGHRFAAGLVARQVTDLLAADSASRSDQRASAK
jgi:hypothetical protein